MFKKNFAALVALAASFALYTPALRAQAAPATGGTQASNSAGIDQDVQLLREDIRSERKQIIAANMGLTDAEAVKFWPVYDQYAAELAKLGDARYALIKEYAQTYDAMTDAEADSLLKRATALDEQQVQLRTKYIPKVRAVLPAKKTALFFQLDRRISLLIDLQIASNIPLVRQSQ